MQDLSALQPAPQPQPTNRIHPVQTKIKVPKTDSAVLMPMPSTQGRRNGG